MRELIRLNFPQSQEQQFQGEKQQSEHEAPAPEHNALILFIYHLGEVCLCIFVQEFHFWTEFRLEFFIVTVPEVTFFSVVVESIFGERGICFQAEAVPAGMVYLFAWG